MFCPNCKAEYREGFKECSVCQVALVSELPQEPALQNTYGIETRPHPSEDLNDLAEWNQNQYNPGYWVGGNIPPHVKLLNKAGSKVIGITALIGAVIILGVIVNSLMNADYKNPEGLLLVIPATLVGGFFVCILTWSGIQRVKESREGERYNSKMAGRRNS